MHKIPKDTIENVLKDIIERPVSVRKASGGIDTFAMPEIVERALRTYVDKDIQVTLYGAFPEGEIPDENKSHAKHIPDGPKQITRPFIAISPVEEDQHSWVVANYPAERIDSDGKVYETLRPLVGYMEIKGLR